MQTFSTASGCLAWSCQQAPHKSQQLAPIGQHSAGVARCPVHVPPALHTGAATRLACSSQAHTQKQTLKGPSPLGSVVLGSRSSSKKGCVNAPRAVVRDTGLYCSSLLTYMSPETSTVSCSRLVQHRQAATVCCVHGTSSDLLAAKTSGLTAVRSCLLGASWHRTLTRPTGNQADQAASLVNPLLHSRLLGLKGKAGSSNRSTTSRECPWPEGLLGRGVPRT